MPANVMGAAPSALDMEKLKQLFGADKVQATMQRANAAKAAGQAGGIDPALFAQGLQALSDKVSAQRATMPSMPARRGMPPPSMPSRARIPAPSRGMPVMKDGGEVKKYAKGGSVRGGGCEQRGKTKGVFR